MLCVRSNPRLEVVFQKKGAMSRVDVETLDVYHDVTSTSTQLMNGKVPWIGGRENDSESMQFLIEALTTSSSIVLDAYTSTSLFLTYPQNI